MPALLTAWRATDDAGKPITVLNPAGMTEWPIQTDHRIALLTRRLQFALQGTGNTTALLLMIGSSVAWIGVWVAALWLLNRIFPSVPIWAPVVVVGIASFFLGHIMLRMRLWASHRHVIRLVLEEGLCPSCGYNFIGLGATNDEDLVHCPECGSSWLARRMKRVLPFEPAGKTSSVLGSLRASSQGTASWGIADERGLFVELVNPRLRAVLRRTSDQPTRDQLLAARTRMARSGRIVRAVCALLFAAFGVACSVIVFLGPASQRAPLGLAAAPLLFVGLGLWAWFGNFCYSQRKVRDAMLAEHLCPSCASDLGLAAIEDDGCRQCETCRAAWKLPHDEPRDDPTAGP